MNRMTLWIALAGTTLLSAPAAQAAPASGMLLGVYAFPNWQGLRITGTIPGYSAYGRLFRDDVLLRVTADGVNIYPTRTHWQIEHAKDRIGPYRLAALEIFRPGVGLEYLWVEFRPIDGSVQLRSGAPVPVRAKILTEQEKPGARALFHRGNTAAPLVPRPSLVGPFPPVLNPTHAASLFGR